MSSKKRVIVIASSAGVAFFLVFFVLLIISIYLITRNEISSNNFEEGGSIISQYKLRQINSHLNTTRVGLVSMAENLGEYDFRSYQDGEGNNFLISKFGEDEYKCSGSCYCDEENHFTERRFTIAIRSGMLYLLTALSTAVAYDRAKEFFQGECRSKLSSSCNINSIHSEVQNCENLNDITTSTTSQEAAEKDEENVFGEDDYEAEDEDLGRYREYFCYGNCFRKNFKNEKAAKLASEFDCNALDTTATVTIDSNDVAKDSDLNNRAKYLFRREVLTPFCKENSVGEYVYEWEGGYMPGARIQIVHFCVGVPRGRNSSIKCWLRSERKPYHQNSFQQNDKKNEDSKKTE